MSEWTALFLGVIAVATAASAIMQVALLVAAGRLARRLERAVEQVARDLTPIFAHLEAIGREGSRAAALAAGQVERADRLLADLAGRLDQAVALVQSAAAGSAREGVAILAGVRAAVAAFRQLRADRARGRAEDEEALFI